MSLPCILGRNGVEFMVRQDLNEVEKEKLQNSANSMYEIQRKLPLSDKQDQVENGEAPSGDAPPEDSPEEILPEEEVPESQTDAVPEEEPA